MSYMPQAAERADRYKVHVDEYTHYHRNGFLKVPGLLADADATKLKGWADDLLYGRIDVPGAVRIEPDWALDKLLARMTRVHMLHRVDPTAEWGLLHPRVLDVLEALIGPDVLALQSMLFFNPPGLGGQGWHQDAYYINTYPETLIGAWIALEDADEENGCLWVVPGSHVEPIYPDGKTPYFVHSQGAFAELNPIENASNLDDSINTLSRVVRKYPDGPVSVPMKAGDVLFFHSHLLHRSHPNRSKERFRRSYVTHYCNARSWVPWNHGAPYEGDAANHEHILARGTTHLPYAKPRFGTHVDIAAPGSTAAKAGIRMMGMDAGGMMAPISTSAKPEADH